MGIAGELEKMMSGGKGASKEIQERLHALQIDKSRQNCIPASTRFSS